jgi:hypothetical protein
MADPPSYPGTGSTSDGTGAEPGQEPAARRPRWVIAVIWIGVAALLLLMVILHITGTLGPGTNG